MGSLLGRAMAAERLMKEEVKRKQKQRFEQALFLKKWMEQRHHLMPDLRPSTPTKPRVSLGPAKLWPLHYESAGRVEAEWVRIRGAKWCKPGLELARYEAVSQKDAKALAIGFNGPR